jgi:hypothetical protein
MDFKVIIENIKKGHSYVEIAKQLEIPVTTLKSRCTKEGINFREIRNNRTEKSCPHCKIYKPIVEFYVSKGKTIYCKLCTRSMCTDRKRKFKQLCLDYKGNQCSKCGYSKYSGALHFHHLDPCQKEFQIAAHKSYTLSDKVKLELDKCILVCANCHAEIHSYH